LCSAGTPFGRLRAGSVRAEGYRRKHADRSVRATLDPGYEGALWALVSGVLWSDKIIRKLRFLVF
jgi:hypothetical protein